MGKDRNKGKRHRKKSMAKGPARNWGRSPEGGGKTLLKIPFRNFDLFVSVN